MRTVSVLVILILVLIPGLWAGRLFNTPGRPSGPFLLGPCTDNITLKGKDHLEFRWKPMRPGFIHYTEFRLYRGYDMRDQNLIFKKRTAWNDTSLSVSKENFKSQETYTWVIEEVFLGGRKGDRSFCSFTVSSSGKAR